MEAEIAATAKLWRNQIEHGFHDNGDENGMAWGLMQMMKQHASKDITPAQLADFEHYLAFYLKKQLDGEDGRDLHDSFKRLLGTDYAPDETLARAAQMSGIPFGSIPFKSHTKTFPGYVLYKFGYTAQEKRLDVPEAGADDPNDEEVA